MKTTTIVTSTGRDLTAVLADAVEKLDAYYGHSDFSITHVEARPLVERIGGKVPELWTADVEAEGEGA